MPFNGFYDKASEQETIEELDNKLRTSVKRQLLSDVPIGFFLSGGLDSSLILAIARDLGAVENSTVLPYHQAAVILVLKDLLMI